MFALSPSELAFPDSKGREWLVSNGIGGYASSTAIGMNTRKYHGLLVAQAKELGGRAVLLSKMEETARVSGEEFALSANEYPGAVYPQGHTLQTGFSFESHPRFEYSCNGARIEKSVRMVRGKNAVAVSYRLISGKEARLSLRPLLSFRQIHKDPSASDKAIGFSSDRFGFGTENPAMRLGASLGKFTPAPDNYRSMVYSAERDRGYAHAETLFSPGFFSAELRKGEELHICASLEGITPSEALEVLDRQEMRFAHLADTNYRLNGFERTDFGDALLRAADSFVVHSGRHSGIIAGFHWFSEWGRDAMISLPGLMLCTGRHALAREVLLGQCGKMEGGLLPNFIGENGEAHYNSADASLWFISAARQYVEHTGDTQFVREKLWGGMRETISSFMRGNPLAEMDSDCLLSVKSPSATWMDAVVDGRAATPRKGKCVEMNALWHSGLRFMASLAEKFNDKRTAEVCSRTADAAGASFQKFVFSEDGRLMDTLEPNDSSLRPNQLFAISLPHSPLNGIQKRHIFNIVRSRLYTPLGLRTLDPSDPRFCGTYSGSPQERDSAYHQGMIWPWLLGAFYDAQLEAYPGTERQVLSSLRPIADAMRQGCIGTLPELYEPKSMKPAGAVSQAWSVAEVLRIYTKVKGAANASAESAQKQIGRANPPHSVWARPA